MEDSYRARGLRRRLVEQLGQKGISEARILAAIGKIPRHFFFDPEFLDHAYQDKAFPIAAGQTISQPYTVAFQTQLLELEPGDKVLEIGTGSGYQASVLCELGAVVYTIEYQKELYQKTSQFLPKLGFKPYFYLGDGSKGLAIEAPYDAILVTAGAPTVPKALIEQLKPGGSLVIPVGTQGLQRMLRLRKLSSGKLEQEEFHDFKFVPLLGKDGWKNG